MVVAAEAILDPAITDRVRTIHAKIMKARVVAVVAEDSQS
jgi:hypothetical protein